MSELIVLDDAKTASRWWILRRGDLAASLTAVILPESWPTVAGEVHGPGGVRMYPAGVASHRAGTGSPECPSLPGGCDGAEDVRYEGRRLLRSWASSGHDDEVIRRELVMVLDEVTGR